MLDMFINSVRLFLAGKLFRDGRAVLTQWLKGFAVSLALMLALGWWVSPLVGVVVTALVGGALQPLLFKDLKYA
ncbi:hypothetical protein C1M51_06170 [Methylibium sp. Pch-M]|uniref:hypothetical protein n=1 Tax=Methylibium sp. Pch-M TaxID=2082386 RepID=UPI0010135302|nr:hypothetical protein [Methylibium sp. Pch-M]QAZ39053.1 hypothetical protein C1M51_06170 [Methylibium sp. Pch-M]